MTDLKGSTTHSPPSAATDTPLGPPPPSPGSVMPSTGKPLIKNPDGSISTERTITFEQEGKHYVLPTIVNGKELTDAQALDLFDAGENEPVGVFDTAEEADKFAKERTKKLDRELKDMEKRKRK